ncbi:related to TRS31 - TRAPP subunit of 31 kDa involved in targeting and fusion of ER to golgi transport vesicles [Melanopsichium pennsylvanicum]|uniref:Related to TRS31 - TRAPP subunit of 31 kDa involved in targeting and fusion of ER to golgi transport vesicles n=1 Tax=Melanopsichium pennsylvanicum TaxID=63383 RepID=A0AAJ5C776_9BASI|nr:related to TRS31 - TRAPP subunit of 31 kDa involved in targeting and fusion of ER to golgi transport vesicles [Melanopsichium pennsylvanicum]
MTSTPRVSQRYSVQTNGSNSPSSSSHPYPAARLPEPSSAAVYSFASHSSSMGGGMPPPFSSRRTSASVLSSAANSASQTALVSSPSSFSSHRNSNLTFGNRQSSATSISGATTTGGLGSRFASFTSTTTTPNDEGNTSYNSISTSSNVFSSSTATRLGSVPDIVERPRDKTRQCEVNLSSLSFLFSEMVSYTQGRVTGITDLEKRLSLMGYTIGSRILSLTLHRQEMVLNSKNPKRETRLLPTLLWIHTQFWKAAFGKAADSLERSTEAGRGDEYMISTNVPTFSKSISVPKDMSSLSVEAITAGMVEAALDGLGFPARVTAHTVATEQWPARTTILIKLDKSVMEREEALAAA